MKALLQIVSVFGFLVASQASANDGSTPYIKVKSIARQADEITIKGGDIYKLYDVLPPNYVYDVSRSLTITSKNHSVTIYCDAEAQNPDANPPIRNKAKTTCRISFGAAYDQNAEEGDSYVWQPQVCK